MATINLTYEQKTEILGAISGTTGPLMMPAREWLETEGLQGQITIQQVRRQMMEKRRPEFMAIQAPNLLNNIVTLFCSSPTGPTGINGPTIGQCDDLIDALQDAEVIIQAKRAELE